MSKRYNIENLKQFQTLHEAPSDDPKLDCAPMRAKLIWFRDVRYDYRGGNKHLAKLLRLDPSHLSGLLSGNQNTIRLTQADEWCVAIGVHLSEVYPHLYPALQM